MVGLSAWHFLRQFKKHVGLPPHAWLVQARLQKARQLLKQGVQIVMVAQQCGFFLIKAILIVILKRRWVLHQPNMWLES